MQLISHINKEQITFIGGILLEVNRAKQIISSPADIDVSYHGVSVWIDKNS